jgi:hypothetical protein
MADHNPVLVSEPHQHPRRDAVRRTLVILLAVALGLYLGSFLVLGH